jgi:hypothetical protein
MRMLKQDEDLTTHIGASLRIEKQGAVHEGVLKGVSPVVGVPDAHSPAVVRWLLDANGTEIHFVHPGNGWIIYRL